MAKVITHKEALNISEKLEVIGCNESLPSPIRTIVGLGDPPINMDATVLCKPKIQKNEENIACAILDGSNCPLDIPLDKIR